MAIPNKPCERNFFPAAIFDKNGATVKIRDPPRTQDLSSISIPATLDLNLIILVRRSAHIARIGQSTALNAGNYIIQKRASVFCRCLCCFELDE